MNRFAFCILMIFISTSSPCRYTVNLKISNLAIKKIIEFKYEMSYKITVTVSYKSADGLISGSYVPHEGVKTHPIQTYIEVPSVDRISVFVIDKEKHDQEEGLSTQSTNVLLEYVTDDVHRMQDKDITEPENQTATIRYADFNENFEMDSFQACGEKVMADLSLSAFYKTSLNDDDKRHLKELKIKIYDQTGYYLDQSEPQDTIIGVEELVVKSIVAENNPAPVKSDNKLKTAVYINKGCDVIDGQLLNALTKFGQVIFDSKTIIFNVAMVEVSDSINKARLIKPGSDNNKDKKHISFQILPEDIRPSSLNISNASLPSNLQVSYKKPNLDFYWRIRQHFDVTATRLFLYTIKQLLMSQETFQIYTFSPNRSNKFKFSMDGQSPKIIDMMKRLDDLVVDLVIIENGKVGFQVIKI